MAHRIGIVGAVVVWLCVAAPSAGADRLECLPGQEESSRETERAMRAALPGTVDYLPFPFPTTDAERIADLTHEIERWQNKLASGGSLWHRWTMQAVDSGWHLAADLGDAVGAHFLRGVVFYLPPIREGKVRFSFEKVEDWTHVRCVYARARSWTVIRVFDIATGTEISRVALTEAGFFASGRNHTSESTFPAWPDAASVAARLAAVAGGSLKEPILLRATPRCNDAVFPCVAAETIDGSAVYVAQSSGEVFTVSLRDRIFVRSRDLIDAENFRAVTRGLAAGEFLFTLGPDVFGVGRPLARLSR